MTAQKLKIEKIKIYAIKKDYFLLLTQLFLFIMRKVQIFMLSLIMVLSGASLKAQAVHEMEFPDYDYKTSSILVTPNSAGKVVDVGDGYFSLLLDFDTETLELGRIDKKGITTLATMKKDEEIFTYVPQKKEKFVDYYIRKNEFTILTHYWEKRRKGFGYSRVIRVVVSENDPLMGRNIEVYCDSKRILVHKWD